MHIILVEASKSGAGLKFAEAALNNGWSVSFVTRDLEIYKKVYGFKYISEIFDDRHAFETDTSNFSSLLAQVKRVGRIMPVDAIISSIDAVSEVVSSVAKVLGLCHTNLEALRLSRNKDLMREVFKEKGLSIVRSMICRDFTTASKFADEISFPLIVKPSKGAGSVAVRLCQTHSDLEKAFANVKSVCEQLNSLPLLEQFVRGPLVSVESVSFHGRHHIFGLSSRTFSPHPTFFESSYSFPYLSGRGLENDAASIAKSALEALGHDFGASHVEMILSDNGPVVIEANLRLGGFMVGEMISHVWKFDYYFELLKMFCGLIPDFPEGASESGAATVSLAANQSGILDEVNGISLAETFPGFQRLQLLKVPGEAVTTAADAFATIGVLLSFGVSSEHAFANATSASNCLSVKLK